MPTKKPVKTAIEKKPWGRLIDLYEREMLKLFKRFRPSEPTSQALEAIAQDPKFQKAAERTAERMVSGVAFTSAKSWREAVMKATHSRRIYGALQQEMNRPAMREAYRNLLDENAKLIKSIPYDLAQKVTRYAAEEAGKGKRTGDLMKMLRVQCAELTANKIKLIARTEISKAHTEVTRVRSEDLDIPAYVWITSNDRRVRESHRKMNNIIVFWNDPPSPEVLIGQKSTLGKYHSGECPNCRCEPLPLVSLDEVTWPHRVYRNGSVTMMNRTAFQHLYQRKAA